MTDQEKLQKLFQAALKDCSEVNHTPTPAFHDSLTQRQDAPPTQPSPSAHVPYSRHETPASAPPVAVGAMPVQPAAVAAYAAESQTPPGEFVISIPNAGLDDQTSAELGKLIDERRSKLKRQYRRSALIAACTFFGLAGGSVAWFVQSPDRVGALNSAIAEVRSAGDVTGMVKKYQLALDKIATRSSHIDDASGALGIVPGEEDHADPHFEAEMKEMMGGEGKTVGERNRTLQTTFKEQAEKALKN